ncbi:helix-turn-helix domain-containing protein, partial [Pseudomonas syringae]
GQTCVGTSLLASRSQRWSSDLRDPLLAKRHISEIARRWGFSDVAYFSSVFRQRVGVPARQYRLEASPTRCA